MANKRFLMGILVMALVFGMAVVGCDSGSGTDSSLNGTWVVDTWELKLNKGSFEVSEGGVPVFKGTFTTNGNSITMIITQLYSGYPGFNFEDKTKWYTKADLKASGVPDAELDEIFTPKTGTYSVSDTNLTITTITNFLGMGDAPFTKK